ncbi:MAG: hypothetical protein ACYDA8_04390 [Deferrisomatales bacterium]
MGGPSADGPGLTPEEPADLSPEEQARLTRRLAMVRLVMGVPGIIVPVFGLVLAYRYADRPLGDWVFWVVLATVLAVFAAYYGHALLTVRRAGRVGATPRGAPEESSGPGTGDGPGPAP